jgi:GT2 family glycosyltransferase
LIDLSVVIASYENAELLGACLEALHRAQQAHPELGLEVVVVDNGSQDESVAKACASGLPIRVVASVRNRGFAAAVNLGLRIRRGRHVLLLNSDALVEPDVLARAVALLDGDAEIGILGVALQHPGGRTQRSVHAFPSASTELLPEAWVQAWRRVRGRRRAQRPGSTSERSASIRSGTRDVEAVRGAVFFIRGSLLEALGELDEGYFFFLEETDVCWRARVAGYRVQIAPALRAIHRLGASSKARAPLATRIEYERSLDRFIGIRRGPGIARLVRMIRCTRWIAGILPSALATPFSMRSGQRLRERGALVLWHLRGRPAEPVLAAVLAREAAGWARGAGPLDGARDS